VKEEAKNLTKNAERFFRTLAPAARHAASAPRERRFLGEAPAYAGTDLIITRDGQIAAVYLFFDKLP